jgi:hypothetical protein
LLLLSLAAAGANRIPVGKLLDEMIHPIDVGREVKLNDSSIVEVRTDVVDSLSFNNGSDFHDADWKTVNAKFGNVPVLRLSNGYINPQGSPIRSR